MPVGRTVITGSPYLGVYVRPSERGFVAGRSVPLDVVRDLERWLGVRGVRSSVLGSDIVGTLVAMNSHGAVVGGPLADPERTLLEEIAPVREVPCRNNALGNNVLANDSGAVVHPDLPEEVVEAIGRALQVPACRGTIAGLGTVGMAAAVTNQGLVVHPRATDAEVARLSETLKVPAHRTTANFGIPIVGACLVANTRAVVVGRPTTPVEIVHLQEGLGIFD